MTKIKSRCGPWKKKALEVNQEACFGIPGKRVLLQGPDEAPAEPTAASTRHSLLHSCAQETEGSKIWYEILAKSTAFPALDTAAIQLKSWKCHHNVRAKPAIGHPRGRYRAGTGTQAAPWSWQHPHPMSQQRCGCAREQNSLCSLQYLRTPQAAALGQSSPRSHHLARHISIWWYLSADEKLT